MACSVASGETGGGRQHDSGEASEEKKQYLVMTIGNSKFEMNEQGIR